ncbi:exocyst complex component 4, putative [Phytophthora infestans T30-4]|uniref:Exocyst complex component Sec8 n=1 Tax=Phytophthora infestans (strain T30-4) TaxID=403677 RepID=D0MZM3_PHYIT|nr:exocyst complex component 4, putative [Phytophthora infestans T30-4]EEY65686.1 exocyst complex component 4, putative [Phytophthora infestans T30-4]|eukprot:XP_002906285.1 exocyst complex component 4, putative [Phytophthora infestans T30-4]
MSVIDPVFFDKKFNVSRYMLRYVVGAATDELRDQQLQKVRKFRAMADNQIDGVIDQSFVNFNTSLARFTTIANQLQETRNKVQEIRKRAADGRTILGSKTKNLRELLLQKYEAKKVIDIINDIECIEAAPAKIDALLTQRKFLEAVDEFASALDLVFSEQLVAFHATTGLRNDLMECKQTIEDRLVQELQRAVYLKGAFANIASRTNQYSLAAIESELNSDVNLDQEFDNLMLVMRKADTADQHRKSRLNSVAVAPLPTNNVLRTAVSAVKKLHRERETIGTIKSSIEHELDDVVAKLSRLCRGIFNSSSSTSFANAFTEATFGLHDNSNDFGTFLRLLFTVLRRVAQRHYLVSIYFEADGDNWDYGMFEVITKIAGVLEALFKLSRNKPAATNPSGEDNQIGSPTAKRSRLVCEPSVFHLPEVYEELQRIGKDLQLLFRASSRSGVSSPTSSLSGFAGFLNTFITQKWVPKVKAKAQHFLAVKARGQTTVCRLPIPSDTSYQPPSIDSLLHVIENLREMMLKMPTHASDLASVLEASVLSWLEECAAIVRDIREQTLNHQQLQTKNVTYADLAAIFHEYEGYQRAKQDSPIPFRNSKVQPARSTSIGTGSSRVSAEEMIAARELELECDLYDPDAWMQGPDGLLMDNARIGMLGYANSACDLIAVYLQRVAGGSEGSNNAPVTSPALTMALQAASWQCSALADECLLFLRREVRLHCCYYLTQLVSLRFDMEEGLPTMAQDSVLTLNLDLSSIENALQPYLASDKMTLVFNGVDALLSRLLIGDLAQMTGCAFTRGGVQQMLLNIGALRQGLTGTLYSYPRNGTSLSSSASMASSCSSASRLEHAKRYYQLLNLSETQLEMFLLANRGAYTHDAFRALWRVNAPHRPLAKGSVNKLDSLLR